MGARLVAAEDEVAKTSIESQVADLRHNLDELRHQLATEVLTRRLVVVDPDGFERITGEAKDDIGVVRVNSSHDLHVALVADEQGGKGSAQVYLSAGGNAAGSFPVVEDEPYSLDSAGEPHIDPDTVEYVASLAITPDNSDPRFHNISIDREGLHFGG